MTRASHRSLRRLVGCLALLAPLVAAPHALAARPPEVAMMIAAPHTPCQQENVEHPFTAWGDTSDYFLVRDGDVANAASDWDLNGATVVAENNPYSTYPEPPYSVGVAAGQTATTDTICVTVDDPTLRFFVRNTGGSAGVLHVDVLYEDEVGVQHSLEIGTLNSTTTGNAWAPSPIIELAAPLVDVLDDGFTPVQLRFRADGANSSWLVDDVYVDPYGKG